MPFHEDQHVEDRDDTVIVLLCLLLLNCSTLRATEVKLLSTTIKHSNGGVAANVPHIVESHTFSSRATKRLLHSSVHVDPPRGREVPVNCACERYLAVDAELMDELHLLRFSMDPEMLMKCTSRSGGCCRSPLHLRRPDLHRTELHSPFSSLCVSLSINLIRPSKILVTSFGHLRPCSGIRPRPTFSLPPWNW